MERFQSFLDLRHYLPITFEPSEDDEQNQHFIDALVRTLIEVYPKSLIQFRFKKSDDVNKNLFFEIFFLYNWGIEVLTFTFVRHLMDCILLLMLKLAAKLLNS